MGGVVELKHQHDKLHTGVAAMAAMCDHLDELNRDTMRDAIVYVLEFFRYDVDPHARAEELVLYPEVARLLNVHLSDMLVHEHRKIDRLVADLAEAHSAMAVQRDVPSSVPATFDALVSLMRSHLRQEEEVLLAMLDEHLTTAEADALYERMEQATSDSMVSLSLRPEDGF
jgi:hemerythrin-like domain-containing protein